MADGIDEIDAFLFEEKTCMIAVSPMWVFPLGNPMRGLFLKCPPVIKDKTTDFYLIHFSAFVPGAAKKEILGHFSKVHFVSAISKLEKLTELRKVKGRSMTKTPPISMIAFPRE